MLIHTEEKHYDKSTYSVEEPYMYDFIIVSLIKNPFYKNNLSKLLFEINYFGHRELLTPKVLLF